MQQLLFLVSFPPSFFLFIFSLVLLFSVNLYEISEVCLYFPGSYYISTCGFLKAFLALRCCSRWAEAGVCQECSLECAISGNSAVSIHLPVLFPITRKWHANNFFADLNFLDSSGALLHQADAITFRPLLACFICCRIAEPFLLCRVLFVDCNPRTSHLPVFWFLRC